MSRYLVDDAPVAVPEWDESTVISDRRPNVIWILPKMNVAVKGKVTDELFKIGKDGQMEAHAGANEGALLIHNIVRWEGPDLDAIPCTPENIRKLDPNEPHIVKVLDEIAIRNKAQPDPKGATNPGGPSSTGGANRAAASGTLTSRLLRDTTGHPNKSDGLTPIITTNS